MAHNQVSAEVMFNLKNLQRQHNRPWRRAANAALTFSILYSTILYAISRFGYRIPEDMMIAGVITGAIISATYGYCIEKFCKKHGQPHSFENGDNEKDINSRICINDGVSDAGEGEDVSGEGEDVSGEGEDVSGEGEDASDTDQGATSVLRQDSEEEKEVLEVNEISENLSIDSIGQFPSNLVALSNIDNILDIYDIPQTFEENTHKIIEQLLEEDHENSNINSIALPGKDLVAISDSVNNPEVYNFWKDYGKKVQDLVENILEVKEANNCSNIISSEKALKLWGTFPNTNSKDKISDHPQRLENNDAKSPPEQLLEIKEAPEIINILKQSERNLLSVDVVFQLTTQEELDYTKEMVRHWTSPKNSFTTGTPDNLQTCIKVTESVPDGANHIPSLRLQFVYKEITDQLPGSNIAKDSSNFDDVNTQGALKHTDDEEKLTDPSSDSESTNEQLFNIKCSKRKYGNYSDEEIDDIKLPTDLLQHLGYTPKEGSKVFNEYCKDYMITKKWCDEDAEGSCIENQSCLAACLKPHEQNPWTFS